MKIQIWRRIGRIAYPVLLPLIIVYSRLTKPRARILIVYKDEVLVVENWLSSGKWALPGGGIDRGETPLAAAIRETQEELAIDLDSSDVTSLGLHSVKQRFYITSHFHLFAVELTTRPIVTPESHEIMNYAWMSVATLREPNPHVLRSVTQSIEVWLK